MYHPHSHKPPLSAPCRQGLRSGGWRAGALSGLLAWLTLTAGLAAAQSSPGRPSDKPAAAAYTPARTPAAELAAELKKIRSLKARFAQQTLAGGSKTAATLKGTLLLKRPHLLLWKTESPFAQTLLVRERQVRLYDEALAQLTVRDVSAEESHSPAQLLSGDTDSVLKHYSVTRTARANERHFTLKPVAGSDSSLQSVELVFRRGQLSAMYLLDALDARTEVRFSALELNPSLPDSRFALRTPPGTEVIDQRTPSRHRSGS